MDEFMWRIGTSVSLVACLAGGLALAAGCGAAVGGNGDDAADALALELEPTTILDERRDAIDFSTEVPVHTHAGEPIPLGRGDCPAVFKYSYLLDPEQPLFGSEVAPNPLTWQVRATGTVAAAEYRVRTATTTVLDWTPATAGDDATYSATLVRSGPHGIPALQTAAQYFIDFRVRDAEDHEAIATGCWDHHPLAAPVALGTLHAAVGESSLQSFTFAADSPVSQVINARLPVHAFEVRIAHQTAEPVTMELEIAIPPASYEKTVVNDLVPQISNVDIFCGVTCAVQNLNCIPETVDDVRCGSTTPGDPADATTTGAVTTGNWTVRVRDAGTNLPATECTIVGRKATCTLPGRSVTEAPKELIAELDVNGITELRPAASGTVEERVLAGRIYTGLEATSTKFRCDQFATTTSLGETAHICKRLTSFSQLVALDRAKLAIAAPAITLLTAIPANAELPGTELARPPYVPELTGSGLSWDSGDDDLPGIH
ncbi:MAG: hypothetical protein H6Q90_2629 [Deltaproteobacteria bacterium]|nr:hypothetical protein [Deltaproteobacteria bacterium]